MRAYVGTLRVYTVTYVVVCLDPRAFVGSDILGADPACSTNTDATYVALPALVKQDRVGVGPQSPSLSRRSNDAVHWAWPWGRGRRGQGHEGVTYLSTHTGRPVVTDTGALPVQSHLMDDMKGELGAFQVSFKNPLGCRCGPLLDDPWRPIATLPFLAPFEPLACSVLQRTRQRGTVGDARNGCFSLARASTLTTSIHTTYIASILPNIDTSSSVVGHGYESTYILPMDTYYTHTSIASVSFAASWPATYLTEGRSFHNGPTMHTATCPSDTDGGKTARKPWDTHKTHTPAYEQGEPAPQNRVPSS